MHVFLSSYFVCLLLFFYGKLNAETSEVTTENAAVAQYMEKRREKPESITSSPSFLIYSHVEIRHHLNSSYGNQNLVVSQTPSLHVRGQIGSLFYNNRIDLYGTFGAIKFANTQQIIQRRPEIALDYYPIKQENFSFRLYNLILLPFEKTNELEDKFEWENERLSDYEKLVHTDGTVYILGINPFTQYRFLAGYDHHFFLRAGLDIWTYLYSRRQYLELQDNLGNIDKTYEDSKMRLGNTPNVGVQWALKKINMDLAADVYYRNFFYPKYYFDQDELNFDYKVARSSYYRARVRVRLNEVVTVVNDFYHFHNGFFEKSIVGVERRFRNIARIICTL